jgi:Holliday junction resolvase RusA-like endonuclease
MITIKGQVPSKSNGYRIANNRLFKSIELKSYEVSFEWQIKKYRSENETLEGPFEIWIEVYFQSNRSDLDNASKVILDCLQTCGVIKNDRLCQFLVMRKHIDKENPRIEFRIDAVSREIKAMP